MALEFARKNGQALSRLATGEAGRKARSARLRKSPSARSAVAWLNRSSKRRGSASLELGAELTLRQIDVDYGARNAICTRQDRTSLALRAHAYLDDASLLALFSTVAPDRPSTSTELRPGARGHPRFLIFSAAATGRASSARLKQAAPEISADRKPHAPRRY